MKASHLMFLLLVCYLSLSCRTRGSVYQPGREWEFTSRNSHLPQLDKLTLKILDESWAVTQTKIEWVHNMALENGGYQVDSGQTGVIDQSGSDRTKSRVWIHPPRSEYFRRAELVPFPEVYLPIVDGYEYVSDLTPGKGWKELEGVKVKGLLKVNGKVLYKPELLQDSCWKIDASGKSSAGNYTAIYYYHEKRGFVFFQYHFGTDTCEINLVSMNFR